MMRALRCGSNVSPDMFTLPIIRQMHVEDGWNRAWKGSYETLRTLHYLAYPISHVASLGSRCPMLQTLTLEMMCVNTARRARNVMCSLSGLPTSLRHLTLRLDMYGAPLVWSEHTPLQHLCRLESLDFRVLSMSRSQALDFAANVLGARNIQSLRTAMVRVQFGMKLPRRRDRRAFNNAEVWQIHLLPRRN